MALLLPKSIFFHIAKTGGAWIRLAVTYAGFGVCPELGKGHSVPAEIDTKGRFTFCFVRNPLTWYQSYWAYRNREQSGFWDKDNPFDKCCASPDFNKFIQNVLNRFPGYLSNLYRLYTEIDTPRELNFIGRFENLMNDLLFALTKAGETFNKERLLSIKPTNVKRNSCKK